ncbi:MAG: SGNH/GDSL hydrolase family protein [Bacteroidota bacterium]
MKHHVWILALILLAQIEHKLDLPKVFLIGDSISIQYGPYLKNYLAGKVDIERKEDNGEAEEDLNVPKGANGGDSRMVLEYLKVMLPKASFQPDYLLLNCGLHDIKTQINTDKRQVSEAEYKSNLSQIIDLVEQKDIQIIWMRTTPVVDSIHNHNENRWMHRFAKDLKEYNRIADSVFTAHQIPIIDLHDFTQQLGTKHFRDHVHYDEEARKLQAAFITGSLEKIIKK